MRCRREIVPLVILLHVLKTEEQIQAFSIPPDRRAVRAILFAAVPLAFGTGGFALRSRSLTSRFKANEYFRIKRHAHLYGGSASSRQEITNWLLTDSKHLRICQPIHQPPAVRMRLSRVGGSIPLKTISLPRQLSAPMSFIPSPASRLFALRAFGRPTPSGTVTGFVQSSLFEMQPGFLRSTSEMRDGRHWVRKSQGVWRSPQLLTQSFAASRLQDRGGFHF